MIVTGGSSGKGTEVGAALPDGVARGDLWKQQLS